MEFKRFVQVLHPIIGGASSHGAFAKTLFAVIIDEKDESVLDEQSDVTYRAYFSGTTGISRIARKISPYIETENFVKYISEFSDQVLLNICDNFHEYLPEITPHNAGEQLAELFLSIIMEAASRKRKRKSPSAQKRGDEAKNAEVRKTDTGENEIVIDTELEVTLNSGEVVKVKVNGMLSIEGVGIYRKR